MEFESVRLFSGNAFPLIFFDSTVMVKNWDKHLLKCPDRPRQHGPYFQVDVNVSGSSRHEEASKEPSPESEGMEEIISRIQNIHKTLRLDTIIQDDIRHQDSVTDLSLGRLRRKHALQNASLVAHLCDSVVVKKTADTAAASTDTPANLTATSDTGQKDGVVACTLDDTASIVHPDSPTSSNQERHTTCFIEFGAGRAELSLRIAEAEQVQLAAKGKQSKGHFVLIDRSNRKGKVTRAWCVSVTAHLP